MGTPPNKQTDVPDLNQDQVLTETDDWARKENKQTDRETQAKRTKRRSCWNEIDETEIHGAQLTKCSRTQIL